MRNVNILSYLKQTNKHKKKKKAGIGKYTCLLSIFPPRNRRAFFK